MDNYKLDSHKLLYHVSRVNDWLKGKTIYPVYLEISPSGACNHRCSFCGLDFMKYKPVFLETGLLKKRIGEFGRLGLKSAVYGGEGEPLLHKDLADIVMHTKSSGIDTAIVTNGVLLHRGFVESAMPHLEWIKISINAGTSGTYSRLHNAREEDFKAVLENIRYASAFRREKRLKCVIGMQMLMLPENSGEAMGLARTAKKIGADYIVFKPYSHHPRSLTKRYKDISYKVPKGLPEKLKMLNSVEFNAVYRINAVEKWNKRHKGYDRCYAQSFVNHLDSYGNVLGCNCFLGDDKFRFGNIYENTVREIYEGRKMKKVIKFIENNIDAGKCRVNCRMESMNQYLWELKNPCLHVNFI